MAGEERDESSDCWERTRRAATSSGENGRRARSLLREEEASPERGDGTVKRPSGVREAESGEHGAEAAESFTA